MKLACIAPDDLSTIIFCKTLCALAREEGNIQVTTFSAVGDFASELCCVASHHVPISMDRFVAPWKDLQYLWNLFWHFRRGKFDAVITFTTKPNIFGVLAAKLAGIPTVVLAVRGLGRGFDTKRTVIGGAVNWLISVLYRLSCALSTMAWFTNPNDLKYFTTHYIVEPRKVFLTKNAVDLCKFRPEASAPTRILDLRRELGLAEAERVVIMVARLVWSKGVKEFVEAAQILERQLADVRFLLIAPPETGGMGAVPESYVREAMRQLQNFTWLGLRTDIVDLYSLAELAVLPSWYKEGGYPRALIEPMAMGKPVIAADTDDCRSPVEHGKNGYLVPPQDGAALASAIADLMRNEPRRIAFGEYSRRKAQTEYDDRSVFRELLKRVRINTQAKDIKPNTAAPRYGKHVFDFVVSAIGLIALSPFLLLIASVIKLTSAGPVFYLGWRIGQYGRPFRLCKFRTMIVNAAQVGGSSSAADDPRITKIGKILRKYKLDELPQLFNVLNGEMSIVGPRPEVPQYVNLFTEEERAILSVRPGITDWATLWNADEGLILCGCPDPDKAYLEKIRPTKIRLQLEYVRNQSFWSDMDIIVQTLSTIIFRRAPGALAVLEQGRES